MDILVIGDPHAHRKYDNDRFELLGRFAMIEEVEHVHCVGDWTDFPSLNVHKSALEATEDNYLADVEAGNDALNRFDEGLDGWDPSKSISLGNHDAYPDRFVAENSPRLLGALTWKDVRFIEHGWRTCKFKESLTIAGIRCSHYFPSGVTGRPQGGVHVAHHNAQKQGGSCLVGHGHTLDIKVKTYGSGRKVFSAAAGCCVHERYKEPWCRDTKHLWDIGVLVLRGVKNGTPASWEWVNWPEVVRRSS